MPQTNNIITPKERLMIAVQLSTGLLSDSNRPYSHTLDMLSVADDLIEASGCIVEGAEVLTYEMD